MDEGSLSSLCMLYTPEISNLVFEPKYLSGILKEAGVFAFFFLLIYSFLELAKFANLFLYF